MKGMGMLGKLGMSSAASKAPAEDSSLEPDADDDMSADAAPDEAQIAAGEELASALKGGDGAAIISALKGAMAACKEY